MVKAVIKKALKVAGWIVGVFLALDLLLVCLLFVPPIQTFIVHKVTDSLSKSWGTEISIKDIRITPTLKIVAHEVAIKDHHQENMIYTGTLKCRFRSYHPQSSHLGLRDVSFDDLDFVLRTYKGEDVNNIYKWCEVFESDDTSGVFKLTTNKVEITNGRFVLIDDNERVVYDTTGQPGIDYAYLELDNLNIKAKDFVLVNDDIGMFIKQLSFTQYGGFKLNECNGDFHISSKDLTFTNMRLKTDESDLDMDLYFRYDDWVTYAEFLDSVYIGAEIRPSVLAMNDVAGFAPAIRGMDEIFCIKADTMDGVVNDFRLRNVDATWNGHNRVHGDIAIRDVVDFLNARFDVSLDSSAFHLPDLAQFTLPGGHTIPTNAFLNKVGTATLSGTMRGVLSDFNANLQAGTGLGAVNAVLSTATLDGKLQVNAQVASPNFNLAKLTGDYRLFGTAHLNATVEGQTASTGFTAENLKTLEAHLKGYSSRFHLMGYPLREIRLEGDYQPDFIYATLVANDPNLQCETVAQLDLAQEVPSLQGNISGLKLAAGNIGKQLPLVDSAKAEGFDQIIALAQRNPDLQLNFDLFQVALNGTDLDNVNGYLGCDNLIIRYNEDSISNNRLRLTTFNHDGLHKYILSSNIVNANFESTYPIAVVKDSLQSIAHNLFPSLVSAAQQLPDQMAKTDTSYSNDYIKFYMTTYNTRPLTKLILPDMFLAPNSTVNVDIRADHSADKVEVSLPYFSIRNKIRLYHFAMNANTKTLNSLDLSLSGDSVVVFVGSNTLLFDRLEFDANSDKSLIQCNFDWHNAFNSDSNNSTLSGTIDIARTNDIVIHLEPSRIFLKDYECHFNDQNTIHLKPHAYEFDNLVFAMQNSSLELNGNYDTKDSSRLTLAARNFDLTLINPLLEDMTFNGWLSADLNLMNRSNRRLLFGKLITDELTINDGRLGDLFLMAGVNDENIVRFSGGLFDAPNQKLDYDFLKQFSIRDFMSQKDIIANVSGSYDKKAFTAQAKFDSLNANFLESFLSAFSDDLTGYASGNLSLCISPDSSYIDGTVHVLNAEMGIAALGTHYRIIDQDLFFNKKGISFRNMQIMDKDRNTATLSGDILHEMFNNMELNLQIHTDRLLALNTPRTTNSVFYGTGYVQGDISIRGTDNHLFFTGPNIKTLSGSKIVLQVNSTNTASETDYIHFQSRVKKDSAVVEQERQSSTDLGFDFTFDVTKDADVVILLESIGGTLNATADGRFNLVYNNDELNLYGNLLLNSGTFKISLYDVVNSKFALVPGGYINFDGPLENMLVNISAYKTSKTSLANIIPSDQLSSGNADVNAYIHLNGPLMQRIEPTFSFELPNSSSEVRNLFYTAIDTQNKENMTKQFAYFLITNTFMPENTIGTGLLSGFTSVISGMTLLSNAVNNLLSNVIDSKRGGFGITYNQATEKTAAEYGVMANANLLNNRVIMSTRIGYYDDRTRQSAYNNIYGDLTVEYVINPSGTWRVKAFTYIGERDDNYYYNDNANNYVAGAALTYKQDFDTRKRNRKQAKTAKQSKKNSQNEQQQ